MSSQSEQNTHLTKKGFLDPVDRLCGREDPENAGTIAEYLHIVWKNLLVLHKQAFVTSIILGLIGVALLYWNTKAGEITLIVSALSFAVHFFIRYPLGNTPYKNHLEVKCPSCKTYAPLYMWQCPNCGTEHTDRHIFRGCNTSKCGMKEGKLHKNLQSITCINPECRKKLSFYEPYEGGFDQHSFRGED